MYLLERVNIYLFYANQIPKLIISPYVVQSVFPEAMFEITLNQTSWLKKKLYTWPSIRQLKYSTPDTTMNLQVKRVKNNTNPYIMNLQLCVQYSKWTSDILFFSIKQKRYSENTFFKHKTKEINSETHKFISTLLSQSLLQIE